MGGILQFQNILVYYVGQEEQSSCWRKHVGEAPYSMLGQQGQNEPQSRGWTMLYKGLSIVTYFYQLGSASLMLCSLPKKKHQLENKTSTVSLCGTFKFK